MIGNAPRGRRAAMSIAVPVVLLALAVLIARWNPWNLVFVTTFARLGTIGVLFGVPAAAAVIALLVVPVRGVAIGLSIFCGVLSLILLGCMGLGALLDSEFERRVLGTSADGRYQVSLVFTGDKAGGHQLVKVSRPDGWKTRESTTPLLCIEYNFRDVPRINFDSATFTGANEVEVALTNGSRHRIAFHPDTTEPAYSLSISCAGMRGPKVKTLL